MFVFSKLNGDNTVAALVHGHSTEAANKQLIAALNFPTKFCTDYASRSRIFFKGSPQRQFKMCGMDVSMAGRTAPSRSPERMTYDLAVNACVRDHSVSLCKTLICNRGDVKNKEGRQEACNAECDAIDDRVTFGTPVYTKKAYGYVLTSFAPVKFTRPNTAELHTPAKDRQRRKTSSGCL